MRLEVFDLELVLQIAKTGSLTQAAQQAAISLQAASERLKKIEQQFDIKLFSRHSSGMQLTFAGESFLEYAQEIVQRSHSLQQHMLQFSSQQKQQLCLWCNSSAQSEYLPKILPEYLLQNPQLQIELQEAESTDIVTALTQGTAQLGLVSSFFNTEHLQTLEFAEDPLVLICPMQHPLAHNTQINLADALHFAFIGLKQYHSLQQSIERQAQQLGYGIEYRLRLPSFSAIAQVVADGVGVAILPQRAAQQLQSLYPFHYIHLQGAWANRKLLLACRHFDELPVAYQHLSEFLMEKRALLAPI
ncbi:hypothetical protein P255_03009 [Acinetobacter brisouii CIP 110357]|uniref:HTH lysR-type domain-containing protein n=1 Tax=Acinetobacter brisouii CIP 110357 TaxID=1341683 RepID=V2UE29_9GAMM|nr:LysR family transcriptional regulator [Acinetobacter brisouii]ENV46859.1 hypothetical protein F954_02182 [Acinetobacter brisouii ANC 4119]ESK47126.1 hypothetical protein P255_03009 [Acinetobacter brisouii CIP 110357]